MNTRDKSESTDKSAAHLAAHFDIHGALWHDRLQDALDAAVAPLDGARIEVRAHLDTCKLCRNEFAKLTAIDAQLRKQFAAAPTLSTDFSTRLFARIDDNELAQRAAAGVRAEQAFRIRVRALKLDWRALWQRHFGSIVAALVAFGAIASNMGPLWKSARERLAVTLNVMPWGSNAATLPIVVAAVSASIAAVTLWWLRAKER